MCLHVAIIGWQSSQYCAIVTAARCHAFFSFYWFMGLCQQQIQCQLFYSCVKENISTAGIKSINKTAAAWVPPTSELMEWKDLCWQTWPIKLISCLRQTEGERFGRLMSNSLLTQSLKVFVYFACIKTVFTLITNVFIVIKNKGGRCGTWWKEVLLNYHLLPKLKANHLFIYFCLCEYMCVFNFLYS